MKTIHDFKKNEISNKQKMSINGGDGGYFIYIDKKWVYIPSQIGPNNGGGNGNNNGGDAG